MTTDPRTITRPDESLLSVLRPRLPLRAVPVPVRLRAALHSLPPGSWSAPSAGRSIRVKRSLATTGVCVGVLTIALWLVLPVTRARVVVPALFGLFTTLVVVRHRRMKNSSPASVL
jgi:hypothetical protein